MTQKNIPVLAKLPSVDAVLGDAGMAEGIEMFGLQGVTAAVRDALDALRERAGELAPDVSRETLTARVIEEALITLAMLEQPSLRPVFNLTGTVLHTNLGRASLPPEAIAAMSEAAASPTNLEYDLEAGKRGSRDTHLENLLCRLTGAEAATVVNNNAAAVLVALNSLALRKEVVVSRGELIEIGGAFRIPEIMTRAGAKLKEVGTTNRTHPRDYEGAISSKTGLLMKVHTSNYRVEGFTAAVSEKTLAGIGAERNVPLMIDLGSGTLTDLEAFGLPHEPTAGEAVAAGANLVTFSGDKLLGGPQAGLIVGDADLIARIRKNPMTRALRVDKVRLAALEAVLRLYLSPEKLAQRLPVLASLTRPVEEIEGVATRVAAALKDCLPEGALIEVEESQSEIGSGSLPGEALPTRVIVVRPPGNKKLSARRSRSLDQALRSLPRPVISRLTGGALHMDMRCLDDETEFIHQLKSSQDFVDVFGSS